MTQFAAALSAQLRPDNVLSALARQVSRRGHQIALRELSAGGAPADRALTWSEWLRDALHVAAALIDFGCKEGDAVGILGGNTLTWPVADIGLLCAGCVGVGVFPTSAPAQLAEVVRDSGMRLLVVDDAQQLEKTKGLSVPVVGATADAAVSWGAWLERGRAALATKAVQRALLERVRGLQPNRPALLIYTSGSTGAPKGAILSHECISASARSIGEVLGLTEADSMLSYLPFSHAGERLFGHYTRILHGVEAGLVADHARLFEAARVFRPTVFGGLPRFFEKAYESFEANPGSATPEQVRAFFGGRVRVATSGGAPLSTKVSEFLDSFGFTVLGAYGLTEHLCATMNRPDCYRLDTVGLPMPGTELRIADDGELLIRRSALTFSGYYNRAEETRAAFTADGEWLLTGDLGSLDAQGMLRITGRKKELIALSTGKKVAPLPIEARLSADPLISQAVLCGEGRKYMTALLTLRPQALRSWALRHNLPMTPEELVNSGPLRQYVQATIDRVNSDLSNPERIRRFHLLSHEFSHEAGELTSTQKIRRAHVIERYRAEFDNLYDGDA